MKRINRTALISWVILLAGLAGALVCLPSLPDQIPIHWNTAGEIDGWGSRASAFWLPLVGLGCNLLFALLPKIDPRRENYSKFSGAYGAFRLIFSLFWTGMVLLTLYSAYAPGALEVGRLIPAAVGILFCVLGNYMPKFKPNYFVGIRTPWTLASENVWRRTHRLGGLLWFFGGLLYFVISLLIKPASAFPITIVVLLVIAVLPCAASYFYWRQEQKGNSSDGSFSKMD